MWMKTIESVPDRWLIQGQKTKTLTKELNPNGKYLSPSLGYGMYTLRYKRCQYKTD